MSSTSISSGSECYNNILNSYYNHECWQNSAYDISYQYPCTNFKEPWVYYSKILPTRAQKHRNNRCASNDRQPPPPTCASTPRSSKPEKDNCFVKAYRWFTYQDPKSQARMGVDKFQQYEEPYEASFARWLDNKYHEYLNENRHQLCFGNFGRTKTSPMNDSCSWFGKSKPKYDRTAPSNVSCHSIKSPVRVECPGLTRFSEGSVVCGPNTSQLCAMQPTVTTEPTTSKKTMMKSLSDTKCDIPCCDKLDNITFDAVMRSLSDTNCDASCCPPIDTTCNEGGRTETVIRVTEPNKCGNPDKKTKSRTVLHVDLATKKKKKRERVKNRREISICLCCECSMQTQGEKLRKCDVIETYCPKTVDNSVDFCVCTGTEITKQTVTVGETVKAVDESTCCGPVFLEKSDVECACELSSENEPSMVEMKDEASQICEDKKEPLDTAEMDPLILDNFATFTKTSEAYTLFVNGGAQTSAHSIQLVRNMGQNIPVFMKIICAENGLLK